VKIGGVLLKVQIEKRGSKNRGQVLIYNLIKTSSLFFTGCKLRPPGIGIDATERYQHVVQLTSLVIFEVLFLIDYSTD